MEVCLENLLRLVAESGKTNNEIELELGIAGSTISKWKKMGSPNPGVLTLGKLADYFDVSIDYLVGRATKPVSLLAEDEAELVQSFQGLGERGKGHLLGYARAMVYNEA